MSTSPRAGSRRERPPQAGRCWEAEQAASLLGGREQPRIFQGESQVWKQLSDTSSNLWAARVHGARFNTDKVTQWSIGVNTRPWGPGHGSATPGERNIRKGLLGSWGSIWDVASNEPPGKQLCMWRQGSSTFLCTTSRGLPRVKHTATTAPLQPVPWETCLQGRMRQQHWWILLERHHCSR